MLGRCLDGFIDDDFNGNGDLLVLGGDMSCQIIYDHLHCLFTLLDWVLLKQCANISRPKLPKIIVMGAWKSDRREP